MKKRMSTILLLAFAFVLSSCDLYSSSYSNATSTHDSSSEKGSVTSSSSNDETSSSTSTSGTSAESSSSSQSSPAGSSSSSESRESSSTSSSSSSNSSSDSPSSLSAPTGLIITDKGDGTFSLSFDPVVGAESYCLLVSYAGEVCHGFPLVVTSGDAFGPFGINGSYAAKLQAIAANVASPFSASVTFTESHAVTSDPIKVGTSSNQLPPPTDIKVTNIGYAWQLQFCSGETLAPGVISGHESGYRLFATYPDGTAVDGYPRSIANSFSFPCFSENGYYYLYLQTLGDGTAYSDSKLSNAILLQETSATEARMPSSGVNTAGRPGELVAPSGFQMGLAKEAVSGDDTKGSWFYDVTYTTTDYAISLGAVDASGSALSGFPRLVGNGERIPALTALNGTFFFYLQAKGGLYGGKTYTDSQFSYALKVLIIDGTTTIESASPFPNGGIVLTLPTTGVAGKLTINGVQDGARDIVYYLRMEAIDPFIGDELRDSEATLQFGITGNLGSDWHIVHSSFFDHSCWYVNIHVGKIISAGDTYDFRAIVTHNSLTYVGETLTYTV